MKWLARYSTLAALIGSVAWLTHAPDWEPAIAVVTTLATFIGLDVAAQKAAAGHEQKVLADRELFAQYRQMLPHEPTMRFFRTHDYGGEFETHQHHPLLEFNDFSRRPESKFLTAELEKERVKLQKAVQDFLAATVNSVFPSNHSGWCGVPGEWLHTGPGTPSYERFQKAQDTLNELANRLYSTYETFIQKGRSALHVA